MDFNFSDPIPSRPLNKVLPYPHFFIPGLKITSLIESHHVPVRGDLPVTIYLHERGAVVPVNKPGKDSKIDCGLNSSISDETVS